MRSEHCEASDPKTIKDNITNVSDDRNELWGSMFGISKGTKITDQDETEIITPYNPGNTLF